MHVNHHFYCDPHNPCSYCQTIAANQWRSHIAECDLMEKVKPEELTAKEIEDAIEYMLESTTEARKERENIIKNRMKR